MISTSNFFQSLPNNAFVSQTTEVYTRCHPDPFGPESIVLSSFGRCGNKSKKYFEYFIDLGKCRNLCVCCSQGCLSFVLCAEIAMFFELEDFQKSHSKEADPLLSIYTIAK